MTKASAAVSRHHKRRRIAGLCREGGCKEESGDAYRCPKHAAAKNANARLNYWRKRSQKLEVALLDELPTFELGHADEIVDFFALGDVE